MASPLDTIKKNFNQSQLGQSISSLPEDGRTPQQKVKDMIAGNPNTPQPVNIPMQSSVPSITPSQVGPVIDPVRDIAQAPEVSTATPAGNWATKAGASTAATNPIGDAFKQAGQIASMIPSKGMNMQMEAQAGIGQAQAEGFNEQQKTLADQEKALAESEQRQKSIQAEREAAQKELDAEYEAATADLKNTEIDSQRLWKNKSTGNKILTGIGLALSAFGGPEAVARTNQIIQGAIDKDIEEQKANYGIKKEGVDNLKNVYARMMDKFNDKEKAELATRAFYNDIVQNKVAQIGARTNSKAAQENSKLLNGQLQSQRDGIVGQMGLTLMSSQASAPKKYNEQIPDDYTPKNEEEMKRYVPGVGLATDAESAKEMRASTENFNDFNNKLNQLINLREKYGSETLPSEAKAKMTQLRGQLKFAMKNIEKLGVLSESDTGMIDDVLADGTGYNPNTLARLKLLQNTSLSKFSNGLAPRLMNPVQSLGAKIRRGSI